MPAVCGLTSRPRKPLHVVMIDELAALTAYCPDRDLKRRARAAINLLCSQGRARFHGFRLFAGPSKEVIPSGDCSPDGRAAAQGPLGDVMVLGRTQS